MLLPLAPTATSPAQPSQTTRRKKKSSSRFSRFAAPDLQCSLSKCGETTFEPSSSSSFCLAGNGRVSNNSSKKRSGKFLPGSFSFHFVLVVSCAAFLPTRTSPQSNNHLNKYMKGAIIIFGIFEALIFKMMRFHKSKTSERGSNFSGMKWN